MSEHPTQHAIEQFASALERHSVEYCIIGGIAARFYGSKRLTRDIDILSKGGLENLTRLANALHDLGAWVGTRAPEADDLRGMNTRWETKVGRIDVLLAADGPHHGRVTYHDVAGRIVQATHAQITLNMVSPVDLIRLKTATGRPHDHADIAAVIDAHPELAHMRPKSKPGDLGAPRPNPSAERER